MRPRTADDGPPVNPERSRLPSTDRRPQSAVRLNQHPDRSLPESVRDVLSHSPVPPFPHTLFPHAHTLQGDEVATHAVTNRTGDGPRGRPGGSGSRWTWRAAFPGSPRSDRRNRRSVNQWSTEMRAGEGLAQFLRPKRVAHANDASRDCGDGLSARKTVSAVRVPTITNFYNHQLLITST
jgi:hypothetical protein